MSQVRRLIAASRMRRGSRRGRGAAIVEFALVAAIFLLLIVSIVELGLMFWVTLTMQYAVREGSRYAITGQSDPSSTPWESVIAKTKASSMDQWDAVSPVIAVTLNPGPSETFPPYGAGMFGQAGDIVVFRINCTWPLYTPMMRAFFTDGNYKFSVAATMRNEGAQ